MSKITSKDVAKLRDKIRDYISNGDILEHLETESTNDLLTQLYWHYRDLLKDYERENELIVNERDDDDRSIYPYDK